MRVRLFSSLVLVLSIAVFCGGCASSPADKQTQANATLSLRAMGESVKAGDTVSNEDIGFEIRRRLNQNPGETAGIIVEVDDGKVTLRGVAPTLAAAWHAEAAARSVKGVKLVANQIFVAGGGR